MKADIRTGERERALGEMSANLKKVNEDHENTKEALESSKEKANVDARFGEIIFELSEEQKKKISELEEELTTAANLIKERDEDLAKKGQQLSERNDQLSTVTESQRRLDEEIKKRDDTISNLKKNVADLTGQVDELRKKLEKTEKKIAEDPAELLTLPSLKADMEEAVQQKDAICCAPLINWRDWSIGKLFSGSTSISTSLSIGSQLAIDKPVIVSPQCFA
jgi:chromosome segregation ATPase